MDTEQAYEIPILLILFNRPNCTEQLINVLKKIKPKKLYISIDGPRIGNDNDFQLVVENKKLIQSLIDWNCIIEERYLNENLGCKYAPQSAITWFFENEEMGIILEDDIYPSLSFFQYCKTVLNKYKEDQRVFSVSGMNMKTDLRYHENSSYFFNEFNMTWGWATWADRWELHLKIQKNLDYFLQLFDKTSIFYHRESQQPFLKKVKLAANDKLDAWDYLWSFSHFCKGSLCVTPIKSLTTNIGFGENATHTVAHYKTLKHEPESMGFPLRHPKLITPFYEYDRFLFHEIFNWKDLKYKLTNPSHWKKYFKSKIGLQ